MILIKQVELSTYINVSLKGMLNKAYDVFLNGSHDTTLICTITLLQLPLRQCLKGNGYVKNLFMCQHHIITSRYFIL